MNRVLVDTNVALDVLLEREPHFAASAAVWSLVETETAEGYLAAHGITTIHYLARKHLGTRRARRVITGLLRVFRVAPIDESVLRDALDREGGDFEDAVTAAAARFAGCEAIVTRDPKGFRTAALPVLTPEAAALLLAGG
jgi:predicted nucleic acid-binding protein